MQKCHLPPVATVPSGTGAMPGRPMPPSPLPPGVPPRTWTRRRARLLLPHLIPPLTCPVPLPPLARAWQWSSLRPPRTVQSPGAAPCRSTPVKTSAGSLSSATPKQFKRGDHNHRRRPDFSPSPAVASRARSRRRPTFRRHAVHRNGLRVSSPFPWTPPPSPLPSASPPLCASVPTVATVRPSHARPWHRPGPAGRPVASAAGPAWNRPGPAIWLTGSECCPSWSWPGPALRPAGSATGPACKPAWADLWAGLYSKNRIIS